MFSLRNKKTYLYHQYPPLFMVQRHKQEVMKVVSLCKIVVKHSDVPLHLKLFSLMNCCML